MFKDPLKPKQRTSSKEFIAPTKEEATTGRYMPAGDYYGTGVRAKVGSVKSSYMDPMPRKAFKAEPPQKLA